MLVFWTERREEDGEEGRGREERGKVTLRVVEFGRSGAEDATGRGKIRWRRRRDVPWKQASWRSGGHETSSQRGEERHEKGKAKNGKQKGGNSSSPCRPSPPPLPYRPP